MAMFPFQSVPGDEKRFVLRDGLSLHLYISTAPCGAARCHFFEVGIDDCDWRLRMKAEATAGTVAVEELEGGMLTVDGVLGGMQRLMNMSCTDKITKASKIEDNIGSRQP